MNLRVYYQQVKRTREGLSGPYVYLTSLPTTNGGKAGVVFEAETDLAARMIVDETAKPSTGEEIAAYRTECERLLEAAKEDELRSRLRITLVNDANVHLESASGGTSRPDRGAKKG